MNVFDLIIPAISQSLSDQNWLLGLIFAAVVTALIGLVIGWLWGRAWNASWTPLASTLPTAVIASLMVVIFGSLLTLHGLTACHFGFGGGSDVPAKAQLQTAIDDGMKKGMGVKEALQNSDINISEHAFDFCWEQAKLEYPIPEPLTTGTEEEGKKLSPEEKAERDRQQKEQRTAEQITINRMLDMLENYSMTYNTVWVIFLAALAIMMISIGAMAYMDIKLIPIDSSLCSEQSTTEEAE